MRIDHQNFSRTVELNVHGTIGVQKRVPFPQKRFFLTQFKGHSSEFLEMGDKVSFKVGMSDFLITIFTENFPSTEGSIPKKNFYKCL